MTNSINPFVVSSTQYEHVVTYADGHKRIARLFYSAQGNLCEFNKGSRKYGTYFDTAGVVSIEPKEKADDIICARKFMTKVCGMLERSGLWANILHDFKILLSLDDESLGKIVRGEIPYEEKYALAAAFGFKTGSIECGLDSLCGTIKKGVKSINYDSNEKDIIAGQFRDAIEKKEKYCYFWRKGYDNRIECKLCEDGVMRAWYSNEYKGYGNGHYYLAIDEKHAIFCEND